MKRTTWLGWKAAVWMLAMAVLAAPAGAQAPGMPGGGAGFNSLVTRLFAEIPAFTARVETVMTNKADRTRVTMPMTMAKRENVLRIEVDLVKVRGDGMSLQALTALQNVGMSQMVTLMNRGSNSMVLLFPELKFHTRVDLRDTERLDEKVEVTKKAGGRETIDGHPCQRQEVTVRVSGGASTRVSAWEARDLQNFPVRMSFQDGDAVVVMNYRDVQLTAPGPEQFKVPAGWRAFDTMPNLMREAMSQVIRPGGR